MAGSLRRATTDHARNRREKRFARFHEPSHRDGHLVEVDLALDHTHGGVESRDWVRHVDGVLSGCVAVFRVLSRVMANPNEEFYHDLARH